ncbi:glycosyltransferase family 4 protein [Deinococcus sp. DB0503]|uniref:glycosyltransferase family 4 protein n=1 Tax=Deinococcus sp. DB0503 TaxID=2479203 RepID=UPI0018DEF856|nr:glycosyltransferase family 4 protein [Deinococcus sp. DB0503]MBI0446537.1 glycosyltransferase [Deinococcus sp. DB0503]
MKISVLFINYGPYHLARARALHALLGERVQFLELASAQQTYAWQTQRAGLPFPLRTLTERRYEEVPQAELAAGAIQALAEFGPDVVAIPGYHEPVWRAVARWTRRQGKRSLLLFDSTALDHPRTPWKEWPKRLLVRQLFDGAFTAGSASTAYLLSLGMPFGSIWRGFDVVDNAYYAGPTAPSPLQPGRPYLIGINRFVPEKNLIRLLEGYARYRALAADSLDLLLVGDGPLRPEVERTVAELGLDGAVHLPGFLQAGEMRPLLQRAEALVLYSRSEPWGLVVNEAMAAGRPVVASSHAGATHDLVLNGENGYVVHPDDPSTLTHALLRLHHLGPAERERFGQRSRVLIERYTPESWARTMLNAAEG